MVAHLKVEMDLARGFVLLLALDSDLFVVGRRLWKTKPSRFHNIVMILHPLIHRRHRQHQQAKQLILVQSLNPLVSTLVNAILWPKYHGCRLEVAIVQRQLVEQ